MILSKLQARVAEYIQRALTKDDARPVLGHVVYRPEQGYAGATDGFRLHAVRASDFPVEQGETSWHKKPRTRPSANNVYVLEDDEETQGCSYPDLGQVVPEDYNLEIAINPGLLVDAVKGLDPNGVILRLKVSPDGNGNFRPKDHRLQVLGKITEKFDSVPVRAVIMLMMFETVEEFVDEPVEINPIN